VLQHEGGLDKQEYMMVRKPVVAVISRILPAFLVVFAVACGGDTGDSKFGVSKEGSIQLSFSQQPAGSDGLMEVKKGEVSPGEMATYTITIANVGDGPLTVQKVYIEYTAPQVVTEEQGPSFSLGGGTINGGVVAIVSDEVPWINRMKVSPADAYDWCESQKRMDTGNCTGDDIDVNVNYLRYDNDFERTATLVILNNTQNEEKQEIRIPFVTVAGAPVANVSPKLLDFGQVNKGDSPVKHVTISNTGSDVLLVYQILFQAAPDYTLIYDLQSYVPGSENIQFADPVAIAASEATIFSIQFAPQTADAAQGTLVFFTNDPSQPSGTKVDLTANEQGPCIKVNPKKVQFGGKLVGVKSVLPVEIISCGTAALNVTKIELVGDSDADFSLDTTSLIGFEDGAAPSKDSPLEIPINLQATLNVNYVPAQESPLGNDGAPIFDIGTILIESNAFEATLELEVTGLGVTKACPTAVGVIQEGQEVIPQTVLHLFGDQSFAPAGEIASWKWTVNQPTGSQSAFVPSDTFPNPTFEANTAGTYEFMLEVWDQAQVKSCTPWVQEVAVLPDEAIHVELLWATPNDPDETDEGPEAGSDVDLHFVHDQYAKSGPDLDGDGQNDPWFDQPFDCFWFNAHPNWGSFDPSIDDDPGLDRDDTDGAGPENMNLNIPENGATYRVGVHYWSDHEYGPSYSTVRIYIWGVLVFEVKDVKMVNHDMWNVATIDWPSAKVSLVQTVDGGYKVTPDYQNPFFFQP